MHAIFFQICNPPVFTFSLGPEVEKFNNVHKGFNADYLSKYIFK